MVCAPLILVLPDSLKWLPPDSLQGMPVLCFAYLSREAASTAAQQSSTATATAAEPRGLLEEKEKKRSGEEDWSHEENLAARIARGDCKAKTLESLNQSQKFERGQSVKN